MSHRVLSSAIHPMRTHLTVKEKIYSTITCSNSNIFVIQVKLHGTKGVVHLHRYVFDQKRSILLNRQPIDNRINQNIQNQSSHYILEGPNCFQNANQTHNEFCMTKAGLGSIDNKRCILSISNVLSGTLWRTHSKKPVFHPQKSRSLTDIRTTKPWLSYHHREGQIRSWGRLIHEFGCMSTNEQCNALPADCQEAV